MNLEYGGRLDIIIGTMFSGKTTFLMSKISKLAEINYKILYVNIEFDNRSDNLFSTHNPFFEKHVDFIKKETITKNVKMIKSKNLYDIKPDEYDIIVIDESHFFEDLIEFVNECLDKNKFVIVSGLMADFRGNKFGKILDLIPICTNIERLHAYCSECAKDKKCSVAIFSKKITKSKKSIDIGGTDKYIPVCRIHYENRDFIEKSKIKNITKNNIINDIDKNSINKNDNTEIINDNIIKDNKN